MKILAANNRSYFYRGLGKKYPGRLGNLVDYSSSVCPPLIELSVAMDNRKFVSWSKGVEWDWRKWLKKIWDYFNKGHKLDWLLVPDEVADRDETLRLWDFWYKELTQFGYPLAFAAQDGMTIADVPKEAEVLFVGGTMDWKLGTLKYWCDRFPRVHVGRIHRWDTLWLCHVAGAESCDSSAWFLTGDNPHKNLEPLLRYLACSGSSRFEKKWSQHFRPRLEGLEKAFFNQSEQLCLF